MNYKTKNLLLSIIVTVMIAALLLISCSSTIDKNTLIPTDTTVVDGELQNGMQYYIYRTDDEPGTAYIQITIKTGSLYETDEEQGLSHYIEHMAFNSTEKYNREEFRALENELGISFGAHSNAYTSNDIVSYNISFQDPSSSRLEKVFDIMSQRTLHMSFDVEEVNLERGVILAEKQLRTSDPSFEEYVFQYKKELQGSPYPTRLPIGTQEVIENATAEQLKALYERWYTPKRMAVAIIGDIDVDIAHTMMETYFGAGGKNANETASKTGSKTANKDAGENSKTANKNASTNTSKKEHPTPSFADIEYHDTVQYHTYVNPNRFSNTLKISNILQNTVSSQSLLSVQNLIRNALLSRYIEQEFRAYLKYKKYDSTLLNAYWVKDSVAQQLDLEKSTLYFDFIEGMLPETMEEIQYFLSAIYENLQDEETIITLKEELGKNLLDELKYIPSGHIAQTAHLIENNFIYGDPIIDMPKTIEKYGERMLKNITQDDFLSVYETQLYKQENKHVFLLLNEKGKQALQTEQNFEQFGLSAFFNKAYVIDKNISFSAEQNEDEIETLLSDILDVKTGEIIDEKVFTESDTNTNVYEWKLDNGFTVVFQQVIPNDIKENQFAMLIDNKNFYYNFQKRYPQASALLFNAIEYASYKDVLLKNLYENDTFPRSAINYRISENLTIETKDTKEIENVFKLLHTIYKTLSIQKTGFERAKQEHIISIQEDILNPNAFASNELERYAKSNYEFYTDRYDVKTTEQVNLEESLQYKDAFLGVKNTIVFLSGNIEPRKAKKYAEQWIASIPTDTSYPIDASYEQYALPNKTHTQTIERKDTTDIAIVMYVTFRRLNNDATRSIKSSLIDNIASNYIKEKIESRVREELGQAYYAAAFVSTRGDIIGTDQTFFTAFPTKPIYAESLREELTTILQGLLPISDTALSEQKAIVTSHIQEQFNEPNVMRTLYSLQNNTNAGMPLYISEADTLTALDEIRKAKVEKRINDILSANSFSFVFLPSEEIGFSKQ